MSRKRRMFEIDMPEDTGGRLEPRISDPTQRRGPMASAIAENAEALRERRAAEESIREENDRLAHEYVDLKRQGFVVERLPLHSIDTRLLVRDRSPIAQDDEEMEELKASIRDVGLSNPIRVIALPHGRYELVQGMRRLTAYALLLTETEDERFNRIPAIVGAQDDSLEDTYRRMVDENLVRKDISFAEMASLARMYASEPENGCPDVDTAVKVLFKSATYTKRSYIRAFATLLMKLDKVLAHPLAIPRNLGVEVKRKLDEAPETIGKLTTALQMKPRRTEAEELAILRAFIGEETLPTGKVSEAGKRPSRKPKSTFEVSHRGTLTKCTASSGRLELRCDMDFSTVDRRDLEAAVQALLDSLAEDAE
ncbi:ParB/RepB/Spo0J family partition protein [Tropicibacter sp. S64]|uniref:ParB/RepB/Spo0J family partition protein n=1 Tax=Tropicibacter sp. S64 TaxID=3415122 RepID=UPI003C7B37BF